MWIALLEFFGPAVAGASLYWMGGKSRGKNARSFFKLSAWGFWLLYLYFLPGPFLIPIPVVGTLINTIVKLIPSAVCYLLAASNIIKEMRAQKQGEYTEAA